MNGAAATRRSVRLDSRKRTTTAGEGRSPATGPRVCFVTQQPAAAASFIRRLSVEGYDVAVRQLGDATASQILSDAFTLLVIEIGAPGPDVHQLLRTLRERAVTCAMMLIVARASAQDVVVALDNGADECLSRSTAHSELMARIRSLLRRHRAADASPFRLGDLVMDLLQRTVTRDGVPVNLTAREFRLLHCLMREGGKVVSREQIAWDVWRSDHRTPWLDNSISVHVRRLRHKIDPHRTLIHAVRGFGYLLRSSQPR
jgi:DNA-binding response OmpR family regulator